MDLPWYSLQYLITFYITEVKSQLKYPTKTNTAGITLLSSMSPKELLTSTSSSNLNQLTPTMRCIVILPFFGQFSLPNGGDTLFLNEPIEDQRVSMSTSRTSDGVYRVRIPSGRLKGLCLGSTLIVEIWEA